MRTSQPQAPVREAGAIWKQAPLWGGAWTWRLVGGVVLVVFWGWGAPGLCSAEEPSPAATPPAATETAPQPAAENSPAEAADGATAPEPSGDENENAPEGSADEAALSDEQQRISGQYRRFEKTLLDMAEYMRKTDPQRADLILTAIRQSKELRIQQSMEQVSQLLEGEQFGDALDRQEDLVNNLKTLLTLLQSEDRKSEIEREKERVEGLLKDLGRIIGREKDVRSATERGAPAGPLADRQQDVTEEARKLEQKIDSQDAEKNAAEKPSESKGKPGEEGEGDGAEKPADKPGQPGGENPAGENKPPKEDKDGSPSEEGQDQDGQNQEGQKREGQNQDGQETPSDEEGSKPQPSEGESEPGQPSEGAPKPSERTPGGQQPTPGSQRPSGEQSPGDPSEGESPQESSDAQQPKRTPGREELEKAREQMERAIEELKKENREGASGHQDEALARLEEAKAKLEEILRQLREEERELALVALEARFQKMLAMQLSVYNGTTQLDQTPKGEWSSRHFAESRKLATQEDEIVLEANKAFTLLVEEGTSVAFSEAVEQLRSDMLSVARLLERSETGELTQATERDIIEALEEIVEALQAEIEKSKNEQQQQQQQQGGDENQQLVDTLSELKMLRSLQMRVNRRTKRLAQLMEGDQATDPEVLVQLRQLSRRQARIQEATYDLASGRNR